MCFSTAPWVIPRVFAIPAFDCPWAMSASTSRSSGVSASRGVCPPSGREQFDDELGVEDGAAFANARERVDEFIEVGH
jgi:hypothetical protein